MIGHAVPTSLIALKLPLVAAPRGREQVSASVVTFPKTASLIFWHCFLFIPCEVSYLHHLETKYEKLPAMRGDKDLFLEKFSLEQKIVALCHSIKLNALPAQLSMDKNPEQYRREKNWDFFGRNFSRKCNIVAPNLIRRFIACLEPVWDVRTCLGCLEPVWIVDETLVLYFGRRLVMHLIYCTKIRQY